MRKNLVWYVLIISLLLLILKIFDLLNINYIEKPNSNIEIIGEKVLILKNRYEKVSIPHLNIKGLIKSVDSNGIVVELSDYAKSFLETTELRINNDSIGIEDNTKIFIKFKDICIEENLLNYSSIEIYKHIKDIEIDNIKRDMFVCENDYGGLMKAEGKSFKHNNNIYFKSDYSLETNNEIYFINVKSGILLVEEIKSLIFPFKIYNLINPQETQFNEIIEIYKNKEKE